MAQDTLHASLLWLTVATQLSCRRELAVSQVPMPPLNILGVVYAFIRRGGAFASRPTRSG